MASGPDPRALPPLFLGNPYLNPHLRGYQDELLDAVRQGGGGGGGGGGGASEAELKALKAANDTAHKEMQEELAALKQANKQNDDQHADMNGQINNLTVADTENARQCAAMKAKFEAKVESMEKELAERSENFEAYRKAVARANAERAVEKNTASEKNAAEKAKLQGEVDALTERLNQWVATGSEKLKGEAAELFAELDAAKEVAEGEASDAEREAQRAEMDAMKAEFEKRLNALGKRLEERLEEPEQLVELVKQLQAQLATDEENADAAYEEFRAVDAKLAEVDGDLLNKFLASRREDFDADSEQAAELKQEIRDEFKEGDTVLQDQVNSLLAEAVAKKTQRASADGLSRRI